MAGNPVYAGAARIADATAGRLDFGNGQLAGVFHEDRDFGQITRRLGQSALNSKGADTGQYIAAALRVCDDGLIDKDLQKQVIHVDAIAPGRSDHRHFRGQRIRPANAIDLVRIWRSHDFQQQAIALLRLGRQVGCKKIGPFGGASAHPHAGYALRHI